MWSDIVALCCVVLYCVQAKLASEEDAMDSGEMADRDMDELDTNSTNITQANISGDRDVEDSGEHIGPAVTQVYQHPYAGSLLHNSTYVCSATILNTYWSLTLSKCFDPDIISSYVTHKYLGNYTLRVGSSYNNKSGAIHKIRILINNFDLKVSAMKLTVALEFSARIAPVSLPKPDEEVNLGYLASILAWTPNGHLRVLNAPLIDSTICEPATKLLPGHYVCAAGVQDPNRHFCRRDDGGAVIQNNTLVGIATFLHTCAVYTRTHAFPKVSSFARWLDSVIWDEENRPTVFTPTSSTITTQAIANATENQPEFQHIFGDTRKQMLSIPFAPISVPLEPAEDNSVLPRMSMYESYLQSIARARTSTTQDPVAVEEVKRAWLQKFEKKYNLRSEPQMAQNNKYGLYP
ncbi:PREDICTED: trypsin epsilon-like isoform X1 [Papilio xuthus]|uniref:Trypsin epsilon-like isoform X1 n=1 Tax=Papilio xuthus TaxID=66420 RepID=A0AAJ7E477_PAPXU|nr:PREDICTED: trypsin epsilon-like isoform X1 [Papilio xuthus]